MKTLYSQRYATLRRLRVAGCRAACAAVWALYAPGLPRARSVKGAQCHDNRDVRGDETHGTARAS